jgi:hypothetical protein
MKVLVGKSEFSGIADFMLRTQPPAQPMLDILIYRVIRRTDWTQREIVGPAHQLAIDL